jgi:hypothetical protein
VAKAIGMLRKIRERIIDLTAQEKLAVVQTADLTHGSSIPDIPA